MRSRIVLQVNAGVILGLGLALLLPLGISLLYGDGSWPSFLIPAAVMIPAGALGLRATRPFTRQRSLVVSNREVLLAVTLAWVVAALLGGIPYLLEDVFASPVASTFESMSGFTTTGATLLSDISGQTPSILFWRSLTQWLGGIGILVLFVGVAPALGFGTSQLLSAEVSGVDQARLTPRITDTARVLLSVYLILSAAETIALLAAGMSLYDAVLHTFTTVATGGFNPKNASVGFYDSLAIEVVLIVFMALSAVSFAIYFQLYTRRRLRTLLDRELLAYLGILAASILLVCAILVSGGAYGDAWGEALRDSAFTVTSILTTTGYVTADFDEWQAAAKLVLVLLMFAGGCAGSTAGGIKFVRLLIVSKTIFGNLVRSLHPQAVTPVRLGARVISERVQTTVLGFFAAWLLTFAAGTLLVALQRDLSLVTSASAVAATLNVIGPGLGAVGAIQNYAAINAFGRIVLTVCMLLGRLELFTVLALLAPSLWRH